MVPDATPIQLSAAPTRPEYEALQRRLRAKLIRNVPIFTLVLAISFLTFWGMRADSLQGAPFSVARLMMGFMLGHAALLVLLLWLPSEIRRGIKRLYDRDIVPHYPVDYTLTADGLELRTASGAMASLPRRLLHHAERYQRWLLVRTNDNATYLLDLDYVRPPHTATDVLAWVDQQQLGLTDLSQWRNLPGPF